VTLALLAERGFDRKDCAEFMRTNAEGIRYVVLVTVISKFLKDGITAAENAIEIASALGQHGVSIGQTELTRDSAELRSWYELDAALDQVIQESDFAKYTSGVHPRDWVSEMIGEIERG